MFRIWRPRPGLSFASLMCAVLLWTAAGPGHTQSPEIDADDAASQLLALGDAVQQQLTTLRNAARDYAHWNEAYAFATYAQPRFPGQGLLAPALANLGVDSILVLDRRQAPRLSLSFAARPGRLAFAVPAPELLDALKNTIDAGLLRTRTQSLEGLASIEGQPHLVVAAPVLQETGSGAPGGWLVFTRALTDSVLEALRDEWAPGAMIVRDIATTAAAQPPKLRAWLASGSPEVPVFRHPGKTTLTTWFALRDLEGKSLWALTLDSPLPPALTTRNGGDQPVGIAGSRGTDALARAFEGTLPFTTLAVLLAALALWQWRSKGQTSPVPVRVATPPPAQTVNARIFYVSADELTVHYQPVIEVRSGRICGLEAMPLRKLEPDGWISPDEALVVTGLDAGDATLGRLVIEQAARDIQRWRESGVAPVPVGVNVSGAVRECGDIGQALRRLLRDFSVGPALLQVEIPAAALEDPQRLTQWSAPGLALIVDHFGAQGSATPHRALHGADALKLDAALLSDSASIGALVKWADQQGVPVIATGVERWEQFEMLRALGCHRAQGPLFARPAPPDHIRRLLHAGRIELLDGDALSATDELPALRL